MDFILFVLIFFFLYLASQKKIKLSTAILPFVLFSILANVALSQNYTHSLIPEANDGIGISNFLAYFLIGEDRWTKDLFHSRYELSTTVSIVLLTVYCLVLVFEKVRFNGK